MEKEIKQIEMNNKKTCPKCQQNKCVDLFGKNRASTVTMVKNTLTEMNESSIHYNAKSNCS